MTNEEQQAYHAKREQELLDKCKIKTKEQFLDECRKAGISDDWYAFTCDRSKPVSIDEDTVYYGKSGETIVTYPFHRWDIAFNKLLRYKEESEWEATGALYRITSVEWKSNANISNIFGYTMDIREYRFSEQPEQEMLDDGWVYDHYDQYMGYSVYRKSVSLGSVMRNSSIVFAFTKRTDKRDADTFGFKEGRYIYGAYHYPVPQDLRERIKSERDFPVRISKELCKILTERLAKNLIEDEFADLCAFLKDLKTELQAAINPKISQSEQKNAFIKALRRAEAGHPAVYNLEDSRSEIIEDNILHQAYDQAGLEWKTK